MLAVLLACLPCAQTLVRAGGDGDVQVTVGVPILWTLEQAHYLLARQRGGNLNLKARFPDDDALNPNAIHGSRLELLRTFFGAEATFDQGVGRSNQLALADRRSALTSRAAAAARLEALQAEELALLRQIGALKIDAARLPEASTDRAVKNAEIQARELELQLVQGRLKEASAQATANPEPIEFKSAAVPDVQGLDGSLVSDVVKHVLNGESGFGREPKLHATTVLDNYVQMQYELIAKQLSLLRDDVGVENRLVFVELPHTVYVPDRRSNNGRLIQSWWRVNRYQVPFDLRDSEVRKGIAAYLKDGATQPPPELVRINGRGALAARVERFLKIYRSDLEVQALATSTRKSGADFAKALIEALEKNESKRLSAAPVAKPYGLNDVARQSVTSTLATKTAVQAPKPETPNQPETTTWDPCTTTDDIKTREGKLVEAIKKNGSLLRATCVDGPFAEGSALAVDLVPRQSALNVNSLHDKQVFFDIGATVQFLFGFGAKTRYQRQREQFEQFVHQDIFASGFGRGTPEFGWTFGPLPGRKHVTSGSKVTYVALVVPRAAVAVTLEGFGCDLKRKDTRPTEWVEATKACGDSTQIRRADLKIQGELEGFSVREARYQTAGTGEIVTVALIGDYFSPQIGVLVNGMPLKRPVGVAQVELNGGHIDGLDGTGPVGEIEFVNQQQVILRFRMDKAFEGTPRITLVTPQRVGDLNFETLQWIGDMACVMPDPQHANPTGNGQPGGTNGQTPSQGTVPHCLLTDESRPMFSAPLALNDVQVTSVAQNGTFTAHIAGSGVRGATLELNGLPCTRLSESARHLTMQCRARNDRQWMFQASRGSQSASLAKTNPLLLKDDPVGEVLYVTPSSGGENERVAVRLEVNGFNVAHDAIDVKMATVVAGTTSVSPTTVSLEVEPAGDSFIVIVQRTVTGLPSQRSHFTFTKDKQPGKWKVMTTS